MRPKHLFYSLILLFFGFIPFEVFGQLDIPPLSPRATISQQVGFTDISVNYSRPSMRGRIIFGELVPFNELWRTGANSATVISFSDPVTIEGKSLPAGSYSLFTIPRENDWTLIFNKNIFLWGSRAYNEAEDALRVTVIPGTIDCHFETFTIDLGELTQNTATLSLIWENTIVKAVIGTDADERIMAQIDKELDNPMVKLGNTYYSSAAYYLDHHKDLDKAMEWVNEAVAINGEVDTYLFLKARIFAEKGEYSKAVDEANKAFKKAKATNNENFMSIIESSMKKWKKMQ